MTNPKGTKAVIEHQPYKVGVHNKVYYWNGTEWIKSSKTVEELNREIRKKRREKANAKSNKYISR